jgi:hypothetical protein
VLSHNTTNKQQNIWNSINNSKNVIKPTDEWKYINMNPSAPQIHGNIKLHKQEKSICPIVTWADSPGYKLAKSFALAIGIYTYLKHYLFL